MARKVKEGKVKEFAKGVSKISGKVERVAGKIKGKISEEFRKRVLSKPKAKIVGISSKKTLSRFAHTAGPVVREVEQKEIVIDR